MIAREMLCRPFSRSDGLVTESRKVEVYRVEKTSMMLKRLIVCVCVQAGRNNNERYKHRMKNKKSCLCEVFFFFKVISLQLKTPWSVLCKRHVDLILLDACSAVTPQSSAGALALARTADIVVVQHSHCGCAGKGSVFLAEVYHRWWWLRNIHSSNRARL